MTPSDADWIEKLQPSPMHEDADPRWVDPALPDIRAIIETARDAGYAIGIHGSLRRDLDLMAMPWTDEALEPEELIGLICHRLNARVVGERENKPFGRVSCNIQVDGYVKLIDLSIAPKAHAAHFETLVAAADGVCKTYPQRAMMRPYVQALRKWLDDNPGWHPAREGSPTKGAGP